MSRRFSLGIGGGGALVLWLASCGGNPPPPPQGGSFAPDAGSTTVVAGACATVRASEDLSPRSDLTGTGTGSGGGALVVTTSDLFARFRSVCGDCHVAQNNGGRQVDEMTFATAFDESWLVPVQSDDPKTYMPPAPGGKPYSSRDAKDPVVELVAYLDAWLQQGRPKDMFIVAGGSSSGSSSGYMFTAEMAAAMTNLGTCVPDQRLYAQSTSGAMESLDAFFASATELPQNLADTDLTTFDSDVLAQNGVIAYVPTYPLWSDGSGKLRHIRVPKGQSVKFDKETQSFTLPPNTRFYKTFFRKVVDRTGQLRNRKMETRVIVARPDTTAPDGTTQQNALFGTYIWTEDETTAMLANLPYRDGTTHADQVRTYVTDELAYQAIVDSVGPGADFQTQLASAVKNALVDNPNLVQHYAIPGRIRCVQCHMGSETEDFVLGFFPLQVARRATGTGGTYEPTGADELNQLQRLIDYGVITGMSSPADVQPLEESEGARKPRTPEELNAQAYMIGNCGHCHTERGFPSIAKPELTSVLDFYPDPDQGGIFEMPLDRMSPVRTRGAHGDIPIPYVTPSLYDYPVATGGSTPTRIDDGALLGSIDNSTDPPAEQTWSPKYATDISGATASGGLVADCSNDNQITRGYCGAQKSGPAFVLAPWRSLIYRNVDTPFPYFDDYVPFPHMPMNTPGFDCRVPRIMGDWMVSIPSARKHPEFPEDALPAKVGGGGYDSSPQPYVEVRPGDLNPDGTSAYDDAKAAAKARLDAYHASVRYNYCQDDLGLDIFDPIGGNGYLPRVDYFTFGGGGGVTDPKDPTTYLPVIGVPFHAHWFNYDPTDSPPPWTPRRADWNKILPPGSDPDKTPPAGQTTVSADVAASRKLTIAALNEKGATLTDDLKKFALTKVAFGLWQEKPECQEQLAGQMKVSDFASNPPAWMVKQNPDPNAPVYMSAPGETLYRNICFNCHGPKADGKGLQGDALAAASDGEAQPANFKEGLFGPSTNPGANLMSAFTLPTPGVDAVGWGSRYMAWMALGGTLKFIPQNIIHQVEAARVLGKPRQNLNLLPGGNQVSANMLTLAKGICAVVLPDTGAQSHYFSNYANFTKGGKQVYPPFNANDAPFIDANGDKEMWLALCTRFSPKVVRVFSVTTSGSTDSGAWSVDLTALYYADGDSTHAGYPTDAPVLDHNQVVQPKGVTVDNYYPACLETPSDPAVARWVANTYPVTALHMPPCPASFIANGSVLWSSVGTPDQLATYQDNVARWSLRGAIAAGMSVFTYLQNEGAQMGVKPYYNECQLLAK